MSGVPKVRVIAGTVKGRHLKTLSGPHTRPTADRVREALFNILGQNLDGATFLDLFAGSGAVGIEALSRGVQLCVFVDSSQEACRVIRENLQMLGLSSRSEVHCRDVMGAIEIAARRARSFDYVFLDPPYERGLARRTLIRTGETRLIKPGGTCIVEHSKREQLPVNAGHLVQVRTETYGDTQLSFYHSKSIYENATEEPLQ